MSVNGLDKAGSTPLHWAAHGGHLACMEALLAEPKCEINVHVSSVCAYVCVCVGVVVVRNIHILSGIISMEREIVFATLV